MIERVIGAFRKLGFDLDDTEIADILWLSVQMRRSDSSSVSELQQQTPTSNPENSPTSSQLPFNLNKKSPEPSKEKESSTDIYPQSSQDSSQTSSGLPIKVPAAQALRNQLAISRSLRPFKRRFPSRSKFVLDEASTAERIAEEKLLLPVMRPAPERWLELALVIDEGASMMLWQQTIKEFKQLLERHGAFRDVRTWGLFTDEAGKVWLRPRIGSVSHQKRLHNPRELIDPNGRRLFVIISDCVSPAWWSGAITKALAVWACSSPMTIIQVLPEWLWERSALGVAELILLRSLAPGTPNQQLIMTALDLLDESDVVNKLTVPVVTLEPESLKNWARMVAGGGDVQTKGFLLAPDAEILDIRGESTESSNIELSAKQRLQRFRLTASPMARKLAGLLAAAPITLPVVRLIQQTMLPQSSQVNVAEVFLGGILKPLSPVHDGVEADKIQYDFVDGVRDLLLDAVPLTESTEVLRKVSEYVAQRAGLSVDEFKAMLLNPELAVDSSSSVLVRPFAQMTAKVLRRFGGKYTQVVEELETSSKPLSQVGSKANIYSLGGTVQASEGTYLVRQVDKKLFELCQQAEFVYIFTSRQMGKSSLMVSTAFKLEKADVKSVIIDLTTISFTQVTVEQWYLSLLLSIEEQLSLETDVEEWWQANENVGFPQRLTNFFQHVLLEEVASPVVVFMDEIDTTLSLDFTDDFFAAIRYLYVARAQNDKFQRLSFVLIGVATPGDLIRDPKKTPFNIGQRLDLTDFTFDEAMPLAEGLGLARKAAQQLLKWVLEWTGGHPYLTQRLCSIISEQDKDSWSSAAVKQVVSSTFFGAMNEQDNNLQCVQYMLTKGAPNQNQVLTVYREILLGRHRVIDEEQSIIKSHLKLSGVVRRENNTLRVRNCIYQEVFNEDWINKQLKQLKPLALKKVLILSANPTNTSKLRLDEEVREIEAGLQRAKAREEFEIISKLAVRVEDLRRALLDYEPQIVHFSGHGEGNEGLALENNSGQRQLVSAASLARLFKLFPQIECVVLNACYSEVQAEAIHQHIDYVIGMKKSIGDKAAIKFSVGFYDALRAGRSIEDGFEFGCTSIDLENIPESSTPVLKSRKNKQDIAISPDSQQGKRIFISYKRNVQPDEQVALQIEQNLSPQHQVFIDQKILVGTSWAEQIEAEIRQADFLIVLLSEHSVHSEMVEMEIRMAQHFAQVQSGHPAILPVRLAYLQPFQYPLSAYLNHINWAYWSDENDTPQLIEELKQAISGEELTISKAQAKADLLAYSEPSSLPRPFSSAQPVQLEIPSGTMGTESSFYVERPSDDKALRTITQTGRGVTIVIKGARQIGKSSLLIRTMDAAAKAGKHFAFLDFQLFGQAALKDADLFFRQFCFLLTNVLEIEDKLEEYWNSSLGNNRNCSRYMSRYILKELGQPLVLAMDEVDKVFESDFRSNFLGMLRSWHNSRATMPIWKKLDLALVTSTEPYELIPDLTQSPFNVGEVIELEDFTSEQVADLNRRHGLPLNPSEERQLMVLLGGHPFLVRQALYLVASQQISSSDLFAHATAQNGAFGDHLSHHLSLLHDKQELIQGLQEIIDRNTCKDKLVFWRLRGAGLVRSSGKTVTTRCQLYADFFRENLYGY